jgi:hypothetical protein
VLHVIKPHAEKLLDVVVIQSIEYLPTVSATSNKPHVPQASQLVGDG